MDDFQDPQAWLVRAREAMNLARSDQPDVNVNDLLFMAQQAAEKAVKAVLISRDVRFPYVHDIGQLLDLCQRAGVSVAGVERAEDLSSYATVARYPGAPRTPRAKFEELLTVADAVIAWAESVVDQAGPR